MLIVMLHMSTISVYIINFDSANKKNGLTNAYITIAIGT